MDESFEPFGVQYPAEPALPPVPGHPVPLEPIMPDRESRLLDGLEMSIQQQTSRADALYEDPLCRALGRLEASIERPDVLSSAYWDGFASALDRPQTERAEPGAGLPGNKPLLLGSSPELANPHQDAPTRMVTPIEPPRRRAESTSRGQSSSPHGGAIYHMMGGSGAGIRNLSSDRDRYCRLREESVSLEDCAACGDYETADDQAAGICRHIHDEPDEDAGHEPDADDQAEEE
jgi:hypothetical protein